MTVIYNVTTINSRLSAVVTNIDAGPGFGQFRLLDPGNATIGLITLQKPSGTAAAGVLTFSGLPLTTPSAVGSGQIVSADIEDSTGTVVASGLTVGPSTSFDIYTATPFVNAGQAISLVFATITGR